MLSSAQDAEYDPHMPFGEERFVQRDNVTHFAESLDSAEFEPQYLVTEVLDLVDRVADEDHRLALLLELHHLLQALLGERPVADGQCLIDDEDVRIDIDADGEARRPACRCSSQVRH